MKDIPGPSLKLRVTKGPSSGSEFEFPPKVKVNIGRLVRGNKVSIKDAGISSKHLLIQFDTGSGHWNITDLDSSNGTILNSISLTPFTNYRIHDNDVITFGEATAVEVTIEKEDDDVGLGLGFHKENEKPKRVTRRRAGLGVTEEDGNLVFDVENDRIEENVAKRKRVTRLRAGLGSEKLGVIEEDGHLVFDLENEENVAKPKRVTRSRAGLGTEKLGVIDKENERNISRSRVKKNENGEVEKLEELGENAEKDAGLVSTGVRRATRSSRRKGDDGGKNCEGDRVESTQEKVCGDGLPNSPPTKLGVLGRLEKMTLGQWLDYIEEYLPKQIVAETEEMIMEMRRKAERFHEFMLEQNAGKGGVDI